MSSLIPIATYNLNLQPFQPAAAIELEFPSTIRITSIAVDPESVDENDKPSTLRMLKRKLPFVDDEFDEDYEEGDSEEDELDDEDDEDDEEEEDEEEEAEKKEDEEENDEEDSEDDEEEFDDEDTEEYVICTLSPKFQYQQVVDITIQPDEEVYFIVTGSYPIHIAGNYVDHPDDEDSEEDYDSEEEYDEEDEYDLTPDEDEIYDLDDLEDASDIENKIEELVENDKKRIAEEEIEQEIEEAPKSKKAKKDKKNVKFPTELEQGPTGSDFKQDKKDGKKDGKKETKKAEIKKVEEKKETKKEEPKDKKFPTKTLLGGVVTEDRKVGKGTTAKSGNKVSIRYIGKLKNGKVFDKNTSGKPFAFGLGKGECIKGFDLGVAGMAVGGERRVIIPAKMGYGSQALPGIPANSELTFDIKLVSLK